MIFPSSLEKGTLIRRYKRFLADILLESGQEITAHCPNSGSMRGATQPGLTVWVSKAPENAKRKLKYTWELVEMEETIVGANTQHPNRLVADWLDRGLIPRFKGCLSYEKEVPYGESSRCDFLVHMPEAPPCYLEVKNVHMKEDATALFPDSVTQRGTKQMRELMPLLKQGKKGCVIYVVQRKDVTTFDIARSIDPVYDQVINACKDLGLETLAFACQVTPQEITLHHPLTILSNKEPSQAL